MAKTKAVQVYESTHKIITREVQLSDNDTQADVVERYFKNKPAKVKDGYKLVELAEATITGLKAQNKDLDLAVDTLMDKVKDGEVQIKDLSIQLDELGTATKNNLKLKEGETAIPFYTKDLDKLSEIIKVQEKEIPEVLSELLETVSPNSCILILNGEDAIADLSKGAMYYMKDKGIDIGNMDESVFLHEMIKTYVELKSKTIKL